MAYIGLQSHGLCSYGLYSHGLCSYGHLVPQFAHLRETAPSVQPEEQEEARNRLQHGAAGSHGLYSYGLCIHGLYSCGAEPPPARSSRFADRALVEVAWCGQDVCSATACTLDAAIIRICSRQHQHHSWSAHRAHRGMREVPRTECRHAALSRCVATKCAHWFVRFVMFFFYF